jgi:hypothetical protein
LSLFDAASRDISANSAPNLLAYAIALAVIGALTSGLIVALAQWRVLTRYVRNYGIGPWVIANIISVIIVSLSGSIMKGISGNEYLYIAGNTLAALIGYIIVGFTLMQILRPYAVGTT